jgi:hypothetical protein
MNLAWYAKRLSRMSPGELALRARDSSLKLLWRRHWVRDASADRAPVPAAVAPFATPLARRRGGARGTGARAGLIAAAEGLLRGEWKVFAVESGDVGAEPDWFADVRTGRRAPSERYCFSIDHRDEPAVGNIKYVWELSRHQHLTVLAAAYHLTGDERYARRAAEHLTSWWRHNPFLSGVHWTSGIEVGVRLLSWVWVRRLLDGWEGVEALFERNPVFLRQLRHHQRYAATFHSHGSSANNHVIAEAAGLFAAACAFPWFPESAGWRSSAAATLGRELASQTFPCGLNRELATDYHGFVLELGLAAALEGEAAGAPLPNETWEVLRRMTDALAAVADVGLRPPRQGDSDDASGLLLDAPRYDRWCALLATGEALFGRLDWWPQLGDGDVRTQLWATLVGRAIALPGPRPLQRPSLFPEAGMAILRDPQAGPDEIWCRCDHGPLGLPTLAAHGHADALSVEVRYGGVEILADPGTYCYHGDAPWRAYFRSTIGHNTLELGGQSQAVDAGPFMWLQSTRSRLVAEAGLDGGVVAAWEGEHDGYARLAPPAVHRRRAELDRRSRTLTLVDRVESAGTLDCRLAFHLGDRVECELIDDVAMLAWRGRDGARRTAELRLPPELAWSAVRGQSHPPLGWYSPAFDEKRPATTLVGVGRVGSESLRSALQFGGVGAAVPDLASSAVSEAGEAGEAGEAVRC